MVSDCVLVMPLCFLGRTFGTHSIYPLPILAQLRKCQVIGRLAALRLQPCVVRCAALQRMWVMLCGVLGDLGALGALGALGVAR